MMRGDTLQVRCDPEDGKWIDHIPAGLPPHVLKTMTLILIFGPMPNQRGQVINRFVIIEVDGPRGEEYVAEMRARLGPPLSPREFVVVGPVPPT